MHTHLGAHLGWPYVNIRIGLCESRKLHRMRLLVWPLTLEESFPVRQPPQCSTVPLKILHSWIWIWIGDCITSKRMASGHDGIARMSSKLLSNCWCNSRSNGIPTAKSHTPSLAKHQKDLCTQTYAIRKPLCTRTPAVTLLFQLWRCWNSVWWNYQGPKRQEIWMRSEKTWHPQWNL